MDFPTFTLEAGFGSPPLTKTDPTWTDVSTCADGSNRIRNIQISRGRSYELGDFETGTCTITLKNHDGYLDPMNTGGPYYPNVTPDVPIRVKATYNGTTYTIFRGFAERWPPVWFGGRYYAETTLTATDALGLFARYLFPLHDDGLGAGQGRKLLGTYNHKQNTWASSLSFASGDEAVRVYGLCEATYLTGASDAGPFTEDITYKITYTNGNGTTGRVGYIRFHNNVVTVHPSSKFTDRFDVQLQGNDTLRSIQKVEWKSGKFHGSQLKVLFYGERAIVPRGTGDVQMKALLNLFGWPSAKITTRTSGRFTQVPSSPWGNTLLDSFRSIMNTEIGQIYVDRSGNVIFEGRDYRYSNWSNTITWGDGSGASSYVFTELLPSLDNEQVVTRWEVTRVAVGPNDNPVTQVAHQYGNPLHGRVGNQLLSYVQTDALAKKQALYLLARTQAPLWRVPSMTIKPMRNPATLFPVVIPMEISDPIKVNMHPPAVGAGGAKGNFFYSKRMNIEHITHTINVGDPNTMWTTELELSPRITTTFPA